MRDLRLDRGPCLMVLRATRGSSSQSWTRHVAGGRTRGGRDHLCLHRRGGADCQTCRPPGYSLFPLLLLPSLSSQQCSEFWVSECNLDFEDEVILQVPMPGRSKDDAIEICQSLCNVQFDCTHWQWSGPQTTCTLLTYSYLSLCHNISSTASPELSTCISQDSGTCDDFVDEDCVKSGEVLWQSDAVVDAFACQEYLQLLAPVYGAEVFFYSDHDEVCFLLDSHDRSCLSMSGPRAPTLGECQDIETTTSPTTTAFTTLPPTTTAFTTVPPTTNKSIELVGGANKKEGNVLLYGRPICDDNWDNQEAKVVCRMLGFNISQSVARTHSSFGQVSTDFSNDFYCRGTESSLLDCFTFSNYGYCSAEDGAGVICDYEAPSNTSVELVGGNSTDGNVLIDGKPIWQMIQF